MDNVNKRMDLLFVSSERERMLDYDKWANEIPFIKFPSDWEVKIVPAFGLAIIRFVVAKGNASVSIYFDGYEHLGSFGRKPYWEIYPYYEDVARFGINDIQDLLYSIQESLDNQLKT